MVLLGEGFVPPGAINWNDFDDNNAFHAPIRKSTSPLLRARIMRAREDLRVRLTRNAIFRNVTD